MELRATERSGRKQSAFEAFEDASSEVKEIIVRILEIEQERLYQDPPPNKEITDEIVQLIRRSVS